MATISSSEQLQQHLIALTVGTPVKDADRWHHNRVRSYIPRHQALLDELADYVAGGSRTGGASGSNRFGCRMPISANALEIQESIRSVVASSRPREPLKNQVSAWIHNHLCQELYDEALPVTTSWIRAIVALRYPVHDLQGCCPICGEYEVFKTSCDASSPTHMRRSALFYTVERASCRSCSTVWDGLEGMKTLALLLHNQD